METTANETTNTETLEVAVALPSTAAVLPEEVGDKVKELAMNLKYAVMATAQVHDSCNRFSDQVRPESLIREAVAQNELFALLDSLSGIED